MNSNQTERTTDNFPNIGPKSRKTDPGKRHLVCQQCGGEMYKKTVGEHNFALQVVGVLVFLIGLGMLVFFPLGTLFGLVLMIAAARLGYTRRKIWKCQSCGYYFDYK